MKENIVTLSYKDTVADLVVSGRTHLESKENTQDLISEIKVKDPQAIFGAPSYIGFDAHKRRHTTRVTVMLSESVLRILRALDGS
jgi:hypothetical protein